MRAGISFVDKEGARRNLDAEAPERRDLRPGARADAFAAWDAELQRVQVEGGTIADKKTFYTALYHALLHPNVFEDVDGRYRGFDDVIRPSDGRTVYANFSSWDTYKAQNQLLATLYPERYADMLRSQLAAAQQQGHLPRWAEQNSDPGYMTGDPAVPMIADGVCRGIVEGDEAQELYDGGGRAPGPSPRRPLGKGYLTLADARYAVATTLEYGIADFSLALIARRLGHHDDAQRFLAQSLNYRNLLDPETKWLRPKNADGSWYNGTTPLGFDPAHDQTGYHEGNAWQYQWLVPHDPRGLFERMGGDLAVERLDHLFAAPAEVQNRAQLFGIYYIVDQWAPGNEHDLGAPYLYPFALQPWKTQAELARGPAGLPPDDRRAARQRRPRRALGLVPVDRAGLRAVHAGRAAVHGRLADVRARDHRASARADASPSRPRARRPPASTCRRRRSTARRWTAPGSATTRSARTASCAWRWARVPNTTWATDPADAPPSVSDAPLSAFGC